jgi:hypothetical protein
MSPPEIFQPTSKKASENLRFKACEKTGQYDLSSSAKACKKTGQYDLSSSAVVRLVMPIAPLYEAFSKAFKTAFFTFSFSVFFHLVVPIFLTEGYS